MSSKPQGYRDHSTSCNLLGFEGQELTVSGRLLLAIWSSGRSGWRELPGKRCARRSQQELGDEGSWGPPQRACTASCRTLSSEGVVGRLALAAEGSTCWLLGGSVQNCM